MTAAEQAKKAGMKSLAEVSQMTDIRFQTLNNWHKNRPKLFRLVILGCVADKIIQGEENA